jgi:hypothetical protein
MSKLTGRLKERIQLAERELENERDPWKKTLIEGKITVLEKRLRQAIVKGW